MFSDQTHNQLSTLAEASLERVDSICDKFEGDLSNNQSARIEDYLTSDNSAERQCILRELLFLELAQSTQVDFESLTKYEARFPQLRPVVREVFRKLGVVSPGVTLEPGTLIDERYEIEALVSSGSVGVVYRARDRTNNEWVAIKLLRDDASIDPQHFRSEAETMAWLDHPNIAKPISVGDLDGVPFFAMQYVDGPSLADAASSERSADEVCNIIQPVAEALDYAHQKGITHRDIKPHNILLDHDGRPIVADFGFSLHEADQQHHYGDRSGTPYYRSPEQVRGDADWIDGRSDVWALGVVLYEMLTGRRPFVGDSVEEIDLQILQRDPKPPRQINSDVPEWLEAICLRCLEKSIPARFPTAGSVAEALREKGNNKKGIPRRIVLPLVGVACMAVALLATQLLQSKEREESTANQLDSKTQELAEQSEASQRLMEGVIRDLVDELDKETNQPNRELREKLIRNTLEYVDQNASDDLTSDLYKVSVQKRLADCLLEENEFVEAESFLHLSEATLSSRLEKLARREQSPALRLMGQIQDRLGHLSWNQNNFEEAVSFYKQSRSHRRQWLEIVTTIADHVKSGPFIFSAKSQSSELRDITEVEAAEFDLAFSNLTLGQYYRKDPTRCQEALESFQGLFESRKNFYEAHPNVHEAKVEYAGAVREFGLAQAKTGDYTEGLLNLEEALRMQREVVTDAKQRKNRAFTAEVNLGVQLRSYATVQLRARNFEEAQTAFQEANDIFQICLKTRDLSKLHVKFVEEQLGKVLHELARMSHFDGTPDIQRLQRSLDLLKKHDNLERAFVLARLHRYHEALALLTSETQDLPGPIFQTALCYAACASASPEDPERFAEFRDKAISLLESLVAQGLPTHLICDEPELQFLMRDPVYSEFAKLLCKFGSGNGDALGKY